MGLTKKQLKQHKKAAEILIKIKDLAFDYIRNNPFCTEKEVQEFLERKFLEFNLVNEDAKLIVAFGENTSFVHYFPEENSKQLEQGTLILIDIWGRLDEEDSPYADITWMGYKGKNLPKNILKIFELVVLARDKSLEFIEEKLNKKEIPTGIECHEFVCSLFYKKNLLKNFKHGLGHPLGFRNCHGDFLNLNPKGIESLIKNVAYTIEPGLYFENNFGVRSEVDFYIGEDFNLVLTTPLQKELVFV